MPERSARGDALDPMTRRRGYASLMRGAASVAAGGGPVTTTTAAGKLGVAG